mgnify:FL=1
MNISEKYKIESDDMNVVVYKKQKPRKPGARESWRPLGYLSSFQQALKFLVDNEINGTGLTDFKTVVAKQQELYDLINTLQLP